jgi:hypothetical protein
MCIQYRQAAHRPPQIFRRLKAIPLTSTDLTATDATAEVTKNPCEREVTVEVSAEEVAREWKNAQTRFQKHARIPGFRSGKVPVTLIRKKFSPRS